MNNFSVKPDIEAARKHLEFLSGRRDSKEVFQIYPDSPSCSVNARLLTGSIEECYDELAHYNSLGSGIAVTVNQTDLKGRSAENIVRVRSLFTDDDNNLNKPIAFDPPSFIVHSKAGPHKYYMFKDVALQQFKDMQFLIAFDAETDTKVNDLGRAMRLAGFYHMKDPANPFLVKITSPFMAELEGILNGSSI